MNEKKWTQDEVNQSLWRACDTFRGKIDSSLYKDYILVMLFVKYLSDIYKEHKESLIKKYNGDIEMVERQMRYERFVLNEHASFDYIYDKRTASNIGEIINKSLADIEEENKAKLRGVFRNIDFNSEVVLGQTKERNAMLKTLLEDFSKIDLRPSRLLGEDIIGNSYEYLISNFASDAGKKGGEFFTPSEVSELLARLVKPQDNDRIYDPTCGSGSLLIRAFKKVTSGKVQIYGQERNGQTHSLSRMNMFLHKIDDAKIAWGDTIANPLHLENDKLMKFQVIVANPPFSLDKWAMGFAGESNVDFKMEEGLDPYKRFSWGVPPKSTGDYAFVLHMLNSLSEGGRMGVVLPHGVLFRGGTEGLIRQRIIEMNLLDAVIGLPANLFYGVGIPAIILIFKQNRNRNDVLFVDASQDGMYEKGKKQNKLRESDLIRITDAFDNYSNEDRFSYVATFDEIMQNDFNLNIPRYVDVSKREEKIDLYEIKKSISSIKNDLALSEIQVDNHLIKMAQGLKKFRNICLSDLLTETGLKSSGEEEVYSVSVSKGLVNQVEHLGRSYAADDTSKYNLVRHGDIVYTKSPTGDFPYGIIKQSKVKKNVIVSPLYGVFEPKSYEIGNILNSIFESPIVTNNLLTPIIQKGAKNTINISNTKFLEGRLNFPVDENQIFQLSQAFDDLDIYLKRLDELINSVVKQKHGLVQSVICENSDTEL